MKIKDKTELEEKRTTGMKELLDDNKGIGVVEIILILVILIGLVIIFKDQIEVVVRDAFDAITENADEIIG